MVATLVSSEEDVKLLRKILVYLFTSTVSQVHIQPLRSTWTYPGVKFKGDILRCSSLKENLLNYESG